MRRIERIGAARYITFSTYQRLPLFNNPRIRDRFAEHLAAARRGDDFLLRAWVCMPEHVHLLIQPMTMDASVVGVLSELKRGFAREVIQRWRTLNAPILPRLAAPDGSVRFWQRGGGYDREIVSPREHWEKTRYIHENPVRRGLVEVSTDWAWSSARAYAGLTPVVVPVDLA